MLRELQRQYEFNTKLLQHPHSLAHECQSRLMKRLQLLRSNFSGNCCFSNELFKDHLLCQHVCVKIVQHTTQMFPKAAKLDGLTKKVSKLTDKWSTNQTKR